MRFLNKLRSRAGESLVESLAAILIFTLASIVMYTMVTTAADINMTAKEADRANQEQMLIAEQGDVSSGSGTVSMTVEVTAQDGTTTTVKIAEVPVDIYGGTDGTLYSYYAKEGGA